MSEAIWTIKTGRYGEMFEVGSNENWINLETTVENSIMRSVIKSALKPDQARELGNALLSAAERTEKLLQKTKQ